MSEGLRSAKDKGAATAVNQLDAMVGELERDAGNASARDAARLKSLAATLKGRTAGLR